MGSSVKVDFLVVRIANSVAISVDPETVGHVPRTGEARQSTEENSPCRLCSGVQASRLDRVQINVEGEIVEITWDERDTLLDAFDGSETIIEQFWAVGTSRPVLLNDKQQLRVRLTLERWGVSVLPDGLANLLITLVRADPSAGIGTHLSQQPHQHRNL